MARKISIREWARIIAHFLKTGGFFYIMEGHPLLTTFGARGKYTFALSYFHNAEPYLWDEEGPDYMDGSYFTATPSYEWPWSVSDILQAVLGAGLRLDFFHEFSALEDPVYPEMGQGEDGLYSFPDMPVPLSMIFSLKAHKGA